MSPENPTCPEYTLHSFSLITTVPVNFFRLNKIFEKQTFFEHTFSYNIILHPLALKESKPRSKIG